MEAPDNQDEILKLFKQGPAILEDALNGLGNSLLDYVPSNGGWTIRQIVHHIADGDDLWKTCIKMALGNEQADFSLQWYSALPQKEWAKRWNYENRSIDISLTLFKANRDHIIQLLKYADEGWYKSVKFINFTGEVETVPVGFIIKMQTDHVSHHVKRILSILKEMSQN